MKITKKEELWGNIKNFISLRKIPSLITIILSLIFGIIGLYGLATRNYLDVITYQYIFLLLGILFLIIGLTTIKIKKYSSIKLLLFALFFFILVYYSNTIPAALDIEETTGLNATFFDDFTLCLILTFFSFVGSTLATGALFDYKTIGKQYGAYIYLILCISLILFFLFIVIGQVIFNGITGVSFEFLTTEVKGLGEKGGIFNPIIGTLFLLLLIFVIAVPLGVGAALYLEEYAGKNFIVRIIKVSVSILRGIPSIVFGLFAFAFFVPIFGKTFLTGGLVLSIYALPMIIRASGESIKAVPQSLREGSYALGATQWQTIRKAVLPPAVPGILTGVVLGIGEAIGETAPLLFLGVLACKIPPDLFGRISALQLHVYQLFRLQAFGDPAEKAQRIQNAWSAAFILLTIVLILNVIALIIREKFRKEF